MSGGTYGGVGPTMLTVMMAMMVKMGVMRGCGCRAEQKTLEVRDYPTETSKLQSPILTGYNQSPKRPPAPPVQLWA